MAPVQPEQLACIVEFLRRERHDLSLADVMDLAEKMAESLDATLARIDTLLHDEFRTIVDGIADLRREIAALDTDHMRFERIPEAGSELDAVVAATEAATCAIMESAEAIMAADAADPAAYKALVDDHIIQIFEACSFQDITGQRIRKVVRTLAWIEGRLGNLSRTLTPDGTPATAVGVRDESPEERRRRELILHGPQLDGHGVSQDEVDGLLATVEPEGDGETSSQAAIDDLFS